MSWSGSSALARSLNWGWNRGLNGGWGCSGSGSWAGAAG